MDLVIKAADFAAKKHRDQRRKDPEGKIIEIIYRINSF